MRILHLTPEPPVWPGGTGGATRQFHLLRRLVERGHEVTVVCPVPAELAPRARELADAGIRLRGVARPASPPREALRALAREPALAVRAATLPVLAWQVSVFWTAMRRLALDEIAGHRPDVVTVEHDNAAHWIADLPPEIPSALVLQNVGPHYYRSRAAAAGGARGRLLALEARRFVAHDRRWLSRYDALIAVSDRDAEGLRTLTPHTAIEVVPNGVASDELLPLPPSTEPATLLFTGTLSHPPNAEGIVWFADRIWPLLRARRPDARLLVVGRDAPSVVIDLHSREGVEVVGAVPDMTPYFQRATAVVVPLRSGGGTRLKILEAFACNRPVVSTTTGCEGLAVAGGEHLLIADAPSSFADAALALLDASDRRMQLAAAGRELAERCYDWRVLGDDLAAILDRLAPR